MVYLVRHGDAGRKSEWPGPDLARPLSAQGRREALGLVERLGGHPVRRLCSSPAQRCLQTVQPLAAWLGLPVERDEALGVDGSGADVLELLASPAMRDAVLCTHGEVIAEVFEELRGLGVELSHRPHWPKGSTWIISRDDGHGWKGSYLEPLVATEHPGLRFR
jgi:broad specificity phosphatase PhoE